MVNNLNITCICAQALFVFGHPATKSRTCSWQRSDVIAALLPDLPLAILGATSAEFEERFISL